MLNLIFAIGSQGDREVIAKPGKCLLKTGDSLLREARDSLVTLGRAET